MKRILFAMAALLCCTLCAIAQDLQVRSFTQLPPNRMDILADPEYDNENQLCALILVEVVPECKFSGSLLMRQGHQVVKRKNSTYWLYMPTGKGKGLLDELKIESAGYLPLTVHYKDYDIVLESGRTYVLTIAVANTVTPSNQTPSANTAANNKPQQPEAKHQTNHPIFYLDAAYAAVGTTGAVLSLGSYISGVDFEINYMIPMVSEQTIYWNHISQPSEKASYKPTMTLGGRIGYGINASNSLRITPQLGILFLKSSETVAATASAHASGAYCSSLVAACKLQYLLSKNFGLSITPEYHTPVSMSNGYKALTDVSSDIKKWNNGFGLKVALNVEF